MFVCFHIVLPTINFDDDVFFKADKVHDIISNDVLSAEFEILELPFAQMIPYLALGIGHARAEGSG